MARKMHERGLIEAGGGVGGGGARPSWGSGNRPGSSMAKRENYLKGQVEQSAAERGGPTRGGQVMKTKTQERMESREAARQPPDYEKRAARKAKFGFKKGGMVGDYSK